MTPHEPMGRHLADPPIKDCPFSTDDIARFNAEFDSRHGYCGHNYYPDLPRFSVAPPVDKRLTDRILDEIVWRTQP